MWALLWKECWFSVTTLRNFFSNPPKTWSSEERDFMTLWEVCIKKGKKSQWGKHDNHDAWRKNLIKHGTWSKNSEMLLKELLLFFWNPSYKESANTPLGLKKMNNLNQEELILPTIEKGPSKYSMIQPRPKHELNSHTYRSISRQTTSVKGWKGRRSGKSSLLYINNYVNNMSGRSFISPLSGSYNILKTPPGSEDVITAEEGTRWTLMAAPQVEYLPLPQKQNKRPQWFVSRIVFEQVM